MAAVLPSPALIRTLKAVRKRHTPASVGVLASALGGGKTSAAGERTRTLRALRGFGRGPALVRKG